MEDVGRSRSRVGVRPLPARDRPKRGGLSAKYRQGLAPPTTRGLPAKPSPVPLSTGRPSPLSLKTPQVSAFDDLEDFYDIDDVTVAVGDGSTTRPNKTVATRLPNLDDLDDLEDFLDIDGDDLGQAVCKRPISGKPTIAVKQGLATQPRKKVVSHARRSSTSPKTQCARLGPTRHRGETGRP